MELNVFLAFHLFLWAKATLGTLQCLHPRGSGELSFQTNLETWCILYISYTYTIYYIYIHALTYITDKPLQINVRIHIDYILDQNMYSDCNMDDKGAYTPFLQVQMAPFEDAAAYIYIYII